jgi:hypothetical protein
VTLLSAPASRAQPFADGARDRSIAGDLSARRALVWLVAIAAVSALSRAALVQLVHAPTVFNDELGYAKLAQSIGLDGRLAVLGNEGLSYSPLYPAVLSPIFALEASVPTAYALVKVVNALLISLAVFPLYKIARFALGRRDSLIVVALSAVAPLMSFPAFTMSENLAYPLCLCALWAMLAAVREPSTVRDLLLVLAILAATAARFQLIVLLPVALTSVLLVSALGKTPGPLRRLGQAVRAHWLLFGVVAAGAFGAGARAVAGGDVASAFGRYADVWRMGLPDPTEVLVLAFHHLAGLDLAVGVIPFVGAVVAALVFVRARFPERYVAFSAVATSFTAWLLLEVAVDAALFDGRGTDIPRIHERFLIYAIPLFLVAFVASVRARRPPQLVLAAAALAAALPPLIPFGTYVSGVNGFETFSLIPFGRSSGGTVVAVPHASLLALFAALSLALIYARLGRRSLRSAAAVLAALSALVWINVENVSALARDALPDHADWVDRAQPSGEVILVATGGEGALAALQTTYHNRVISRVYALCWQVFGADAGERQLSIDESGSFRSSARPVTASYAVVQAGLGVRGRVVARNVEGRQVLLELPDRRLRMTAEGGVPRC